MNELVKELAEQADLLEVIDDAYQERCDWQPVVQKFAELIILECALALDETIAPPSHPFNSIGYKLKNHFGIE
jgi:hypothetical protein